MNRNAHKVLVEKRERRKPIGRPKYRYKDIKLDLK
jgi:predicted transcriptional regulator